MLRYRIPRKCYVVFMIVCVICFILFNSNEQSLHGSKQMYRKGDHDYLHYHYELTQVSKYEYRQQRYLKAQTQLNGSGVGENGEPVILNVDDQKLADELFEKEAFNIVASDKVALDRSIPDDRLPEYVLL